MVTVGAIGLGVGGGRARHLGPATNVFATAGARDTYAAAEVNAAWLRAYEDDRSNVVIVGAAGTAGGPFYAIDQRTGDRDALWVGVSDPVSDRVLHAFLASGGSDTDDDIDYSATNRNTTLSLASNKTRIYILYERANSHYIAAYSIDGDHHSNEDITLGNPPGSGAEWRGVAATDARIYVLWRSSDETSSGVQTWSTGTSPARQASEDANLTVAGARDISATATRFRVLSQARPPSVYSYDTSWTRQNGETLLLSQLWSGYSAVTEHGGELFVLARDHSSDPQQNGSALAYTVPVSGAPTGPVRTIRTGLASADAMTSDYVAGSVTWVQVPGDGVAGAMGARGADGAAALADGGDATYTMSSPARRLLAPSSGRIAIPSNTQIIKGEFEFADSAGQHGYRGVDLRRLRALPAASNGDAVSASNAIIFPDAGGTGQYDVYVGRDASNDLLVASGSQSAVLVCHMDYLLPGAVASVGPENVTAAIERAQAAQDARILTALGIEGGATGDMTPAEIIAAFRAANAEWDYAQDITNEPSIPSLANYWDRDQIATALTTATAGLQDADEVNTLIGNALAAAVTGNTEVGITVTYANGKYSFRVTAQGGGGSVPTHTRYVAAKATTSFVEADFTGGTSSTTDTITLPTFTANRYIAIAVPDDTGDITSIVQQGGSRNQIGAFTRVAGTIQIGGVAYKVWRSNSRFLPVTSGVNYTIAQA